MQRVLTAAVLLPIVILLIQKAPPFYLFLFLCLLILLGLSELFSMLAHKQQACYPLPGLILGGLLPLAFFQAQGEWIHLILTAAPITLLIGQLFSPQDFRESLQGIANTLFAILYISWSLSHFLPLRELEDGRGYIFLILLVIWFGDTAAYYVGRTWGRHPLAKRISPKKTVEGAVGGLLGGLLGAWIAHLGFLSSWSAPHCLLLGLGLNALGQLGDLGESLIKRGLEVKDSGSLLPGHGGVLDRVDSLLFATPAMYYYVILRG
ncbi:MAG: phosphatidate cytidylyltransferase [Candidatus Tectomicrobia bacterium]|uniref:Phosphatidate cytidylyltransferase n=1 Tax=Tectimicrobiota bacterium TaxID=2528274 RepID=A0A932CSL6_UNCTE|nr:phosphatidate cytidylyltransferase [Candidatus Tectomicrobia bacterium]